MAGRTQASRSEASTGKVLEAALGLFASQGFRATSIREIAKASGMSVGNLYHHFGGKEPIFQRLIDDYWEYLLDPELALNKVFAQAGFPDDLEELAAAIEEVVLEKKEHILLVYIDVIEFGGKHIRTFYETMADRFQTACANSFEEMQRQGRLGEVNPLVAVMVCTRWLFHFFTVEKCFGVPMHFGMGSAEAVTEFAKIVRYGVLPRPAPDTIDGPTQEEGGRHA